MLLTDEQLTHLRVTDTLAEAIDKALAGYDDTLSAPTSVLHMAATAALAVLLAYNRPRDDPDEPVINVNGHAPPRRKATIASNRKNAQAGAECPLCGKHINRAGNLARHIKATHSNAPAAAPSSAT